MADIIFGISNFQISEIPGFKDVKCDTPGANEVKPRKLRTLDIRPLTDIRGPLFRCPILHVETEIARRRSWKAEITPDVSKFRVFGCKMRRSWF